MSGLFARWIVARIHAWILAWIRARIRARILTRIRARIRARILAQIRALIRLGSVSGSGARSDPGQILAHKK